MKINRAAGNLFWDSNILPENGIVHCYANWSIAGQLVDRLTKDLDDYPTLDFWIITVDSIAMKLFTDKYSVHSDGKGETYWLHKGKIVSFIYDIRSQIYDVSLGGSKQLLKSNCELLLSLHSNIQEGTKKNGSD